MHTASQHATCQKIYTLFRGIPLFHESESWERLTSSELATDIIYDLLVIKKPVLQTVEKVCGNTFDETRRVTRRTVLDLFVWWKTDAPDAPSLRSKKK